MPIFGQRFYQCEQCDKRTNEKGVILCYEDGSWLCAVCRWKQTPPDVRKEDYLMRSHDKGGHIVHSNIYCNYCNGAAFLTVVADIEAEMNGPKVITLRQTSVRRIHN